MAFCSSLPCPVQFRFQSSWPVSRIPQLLISSTPLHCYPLSLQTCSGRASQLKTHCCSESEAELSCLRRPGPRGADPGGLEVSAFQSGASELRNWRFLLGLGVFRPPTRTIPSGSLAVCDTSSFGQRSSGGMLPSSLVQDRNHHERRIRELYGTFDKRRSSSQLPTRLGPKLFNCTAVGIWSPTLAFLRPIGQTSLGRRPERGFELFGV